MSCGRGCTGLDRVTKMSNFNANRIANVPVTQWTKGESQAVKLVQRLISLDESFGFENVELFDYLRPYHGLSVGEAISQLRADVADACERNETHDLDVMVREFQDV